MPVPWLSQVLAVMEEIVEVHIIHSLTLLADHYMLLSSSHRLEDLIFLNYQNR